jgi:transcriptional regulator with XRE-family HTH domain
MSFSALRLREAREAAGLTREQLAVQVGRSYSMLAQYESAAKQPSLDALTRLAEALDRPVGDFFDDADLVGEEQ